jgi:hypothetical protein
VGKKTEQIKRLNLSEVAIELIRADVWYNGHSYEAARTPGLAAERVDVVL